MTTLRDQTAEALRNTRMREQLARILTGRTFTSSERARTLLDFLVTSTIRGDEVRESVIAVKIFKRSGQWNSKRDTIVRTSIIRLRQLLKQYFATEGKHDPYEIRIPKGSYVPEFHPRTAEVISERPPVRTRVANPFHDAGNTTPTAGLVGREAELVKLHAHLDEARHSKGGLVCVIAEPGIGKTALIEEFVFEAGADPSHLIASGCCYPELESTEVYGVWRRLLSVLIRDDQSIIPVLQETAPSWAAFLDRYELGSAIFQAAGSKREMLDFVTALSRRKTAIFFLDDLHWADTATVDLLQYLCLQSVTLRLLIVTAYRPSDMRRGRNAFLRVQPELKIRGQCTDLLLRELNYTEVQRLVDLRFVPHRFKDDLVSWLFGLTQGNPFALTRVTDHAVRRGWVRRVRRTWVTDGHPSEWTLELPESLQGWIAQKMEDIDTPDMAIARIAAVHGAEFEAEVLARALQRDVVSVEQQLETLDRLHGLLARLPDIQVPGRGAVRRYRFAHPLFQEALLHLIGPIERGRLSLSLAEALLALFGSIPSEAGITARLLEGGGDFERALECYLKATSYAVRISAYKQALDMARRGEEVIGLMRQTELTDRRTIECLTLQALAASTLGGFGASQITDIYDRAIQVSRRLRDEGSSFPIANVYWGFVSNTDYGRAQSVADQLLIQANATHQKEAMALAQLAVGVSSLHRGELAQAEAVLRESSRIWKTSTGDRSHIHLFTMDPAVATSLMLARTQCLSGQWTAAEQNCEIALRLAREIKHERTLAYAVALSADIFHLGGDAPKALRIAEEAERMATQFELPYECIWARAIKAWALAQSGDAATAIALFRDSLAQYRGPASTKLLCHYAEALLSAGQLTAASAVLNDAVAVSQSLGERYYEAELLRVRGELILRKARPSPERAARLFQEALRAAASQGAKALELRAAISHYRLSRQEGISSGEAHDRLKYLLHVVSKGGVTRDVKAGANLLSR
jgi:tetratricopeptide (TPR) repeat protein